MTEQTLAERVEAVPVRHAIVPESYSQDVTKMVEAAGVELEPFCRRERSGSLRAKS